MNFDRLVLDYAITRLDTLQERLTKIHEIANARFDVSTVLTALRGIREHDSLRSQYAQIFNQCNVLLVSYFSSAVADIFRASVTDAIKWGDRSKLLKEDIKIGLNEIRDIGPELLERAGELLVAHKDISFQDMQSIGRAFRDYFDYDPPKTDVVNDIIVSQACRHVIVHSGGIVDRKMLGQVRNATPRTLQPRVQEHQRIQFTESDIELVGRQMKAYLHELAMNVGGEGPDLRAG